MIEFIAMFGLLLFGAVTPEGTPVTVRGEAGIKVVIDPATGRIIPEPTAADLETLSRGRRSERRGSMWELRRFALTHGGEGVFLDGWADHSLWVRQDGDRIQVVCSLGHDHGSAADDAEENLE